MRLQTYLNEEKYAIIKASGKKVILTGKTKTRAGCKEYIQVLIPWTKEDDKKYKEQWKEDRPKKDRGLKTYILRGGLNLI